MEDIIKRLHIIIVFLILIILFTIAGTCQNRPSSKATIELRKNIEKAREEDWKKDVEQSSKDIKKENEDSEENNKSIPVTLKGYIEVVDIAENILEPISITIDKAKNKVEGETTLYWHEEIEVSGESGESHNSHSYICRVEIKGYIFGNIIKIDENKYSIYATLSGFATGDYRSDLKSTEDSIDMEASDFCKNEFDGKQYIWTITGTYRDFIKNASGKIVSNGWSWEVN